MTYNPFTYLKNTATDIFTDAAGIGYAGYSGFQSLKNINADRAEFKKSSAGLEALKTAINSCGFEDKESQELIAAVSKCNYKSIVSRDITNQDKQFNLVKLLYKAIEDEKDGPKKTQLKDIITQINDTLSTLDGHIKKYQPNKLDKALLVKSLIAIVSSCCIIFQYCPESIKSLGKFLANKTPDYGFVEKMQSLSSLLDYKGFLGAALSFAINYKKPIAAFVGIIGLIKLGKVGCTKLNPALTHYSNKKFIEDQNAVRKDLINLGEQIQALNTAKFPAPSA